jgi:hypothetical protein
VKLAKGRALLESNVVRILNLKERVFSVASGNVQKPELKYTVCTNDSISCVANAFR